MTRSALLLAALLTSASPALAGDARLVTRLYSPDEVVRIDGQIGVQASIAFGEAEHIENVAIGDSANWQVTPNKQTNLLFVKPLSPRARTNMTVVTDRHTYYFDLVAAPSGRPLYVLRFTYPQVPGSENAQAATAGVAAPERAALAEQPVADPATLNFAWRPRGKSALFPARIYDDGESTYISWPVGSPIPAILVNDGRGNEGPVNFAVRGDVIIVDGVPGTILLRSGKDLATLQNQGPARPASAAPEPVAAPALAAATPAQAPISAQEQ